MAGDWLRLHRKLIDSRVFADPKLLKIWIWCLCKANWKPAWFRGQKIEVGQFATGRSTAAEELGMSGSAVYRGLQRLEEWGMVKLQANNKWTTLTLCNWATYQLATLASEQQADNKRTTSGQQADTIEEGKTKKKERRSMCIDPPTLSDVSEYCNQRCNSIDPQEFLDYYASQGWKKKNGRPLVDWKAGVRTWEKNRTSSASKDPRGNIATAERWLHSQGEQDGQ